MVNVNLESIREYFPPLKRFIARLREEEIELLSEKNKVEVNANEVFECLSWARRAPRGSAGSRRCR